MGWFHGESVGELRTAFEEAVEDYLTTREKRIARRRSPIQAGSRCACRLRSMRRSPAARKRVVRASISGLLRHSRGPCTPRHSGSGRLQARVFVIAQRPSGPLFPHVRLYPRRLALIPDLLGIIAINFAIVQLQFGGSVEQLLAQLKNTVMAATARWAAARARRRDAATRRRGNGAIIAAPRDWTRLWRS